MEEIHVKDAAFSFGELLHLTPGTVIPGLKSTDLHEWNVSKEWVLPTNKKTISVPALLEQDCQFLYNLKPTFTSKTGVVVYTPQEKQLKNLLFSVRKVPMKIETDRPIGLFLGCILRFKYKCFVLVGLGNGHSVWI